MITCELMSYGIMAYVARESIHLIMDHRHVCSKWTMTYDQQGNVAYMFGNESSVKFTVEATVK